MKVILIFTFSLLAACTAYAQTRTYIPARAFTGASIGAGIGRGAGQAMQGWIELKQAGEQFNKEMAEARARHWELYPDKPGYEEARVEFEQKLLSKDVGMLLMRVATPDHWKASPGGSLFGTTFEDMVNKQAGGFDGGPPGGTASYFNLWVNQILNSLGGSSDERHLRMIMNPASFTEAFQAALPAYLNYAHVRDFSEFAKAGFWEDFYQSPEALLVDAIRYRELAAGGAISVDAAQGRLEVIFQLYGRNLLIKAANRVRSNHMAGSFVVQKNGPVGLPVSDSQENAILYLIGPELSPKQYVLALYRGLRAESDRIDDLRIVKEFGEKAVLEAAKGLQATLMMPDVARRSLARALDLARVDELGDTVLQLNRDLLKEAGVPRHPVSTAGGGFWVSKNNTEFTIRRAETGEVLNAVIFPAVSKRVAVTSTHLLIGGVNSDTKENMAMLYRISDGKLLQTFKRPNLYLLSNFGADVALTAQYAIVTCGELRQFKSKVGPRIQDTSGPVETVIYDLQTGQEVRSIPDAGEIAASDNRLIIVRNSRDELGYFETQPHGTIYDLETGGEIGTLDFSGVEARAFRAGERTEPHAFEVAVDEGIIAVYLPNAAPTGRVVCFDVTTGQQLSILDTGMSDRKYQPRHLGFSDLENQMVLVGDRLLIRARTGSSENDMHHVFNALSGRPLRSFVEVSSRVEPYEGPLMFDGKHILVRPSNITCRVPLHQLEANARNWELTDDPGIAIRKQQDPNQVALAVEAALERERLRLIEEERLAAERLAAAEARLDLSIFNSSERFQLDRYARTKFYDLPMETNDGRRAAHERSLATIERRHERFKRLTDLRVEMHAFNTIIEETRERLGSRNRREARDAELKIAWLQSKVDRANRQLEAGLEQDASGDLPPPLMGTPRRTANNYAKTLLVDLPKEETEVRRNQKKRALETSIQRNAFLAELPLAQLELLAAEAVIYSLEPREENWGTDSRSAAMRSELQSARERLPALQAKWASMRAEGSGQPHNLGALLERSEPLASPIVDDSGGSASGGRRGPGRVTPPPDMLTPEPIPNRRRPPVPPTTETVVVPEPVDDRRSPPSIPKVVKESPTVDPGPMEFDAFLKALEIVRSASQLKLNELNQEREALGIDPIDTYDDYGQWVMMAAGFWSQFAATGSKEHYDNTKTAISRIGRVDPQLLKEMRVALPFLYDRSSQEKSRTSIEVVQSGRIDAGELDSEKALVLLASDKRMDLLRALQSAEQDLRSREVMNAQQKQRRELTERSLRNFATQIETRQKKVEAARQALLEYDAELQKN